MTAYFSCQMLTVPARKRSISIILSNSCPDGNYLSYSHQSPCCASSLFLTSSESDGPDLMNADQLVLLECIALYVTVDLLRNTCTYCQSQHPTPELSSTQFLLGHLIHSLRECQSPLCLVAGSTTPSALCTLYPSRSRREVVRRARPQYSCW
jgi:hypothetical protein